MKNITEKPALLFPGNGEAVLVQQNPIKPSDWFEMLSINCYGI